jgi:hypothetical protein
MRDERTEAAVDSSGKEKGLGWSFVTISRGQSFTTMREDEISNRLKIYINIT